MHNQQQHLQTKNVSKFAVIVLSIVLLTGISLVPALQIGVQGQLQHQQTPQRQKQVGLSQVIKQIAQQVASANPGTTANHVQQILVQLAKQTAQISDQSTAIQVIKQIGSQVSSFPKGRVSQALIQIAKQQAAGNTTLVTQVMQQAAQQIRTGVPGANALVQVALQAAAGGVPGINQQLNQIAQQVANGTGAQQTQILQTLQQIALQISNTEGGGKDKVVHTVKVIHDDVSKNNKGRVSKSIERYNHYEVTCNYCPVFNGPVYIHEGDIINNFVDYGIQLAVGSPGAVQQMNQITEQVSLETGGDPAEVKGVVQNLALTNSIKGGNTQELINKIGMEVTQPNDPVSKSLNSLAIQEEQGNDEAVNIAVEKVAEGAVGGNDVEQLVTTAAATTTEGTTGAAPLGEATGEFGTTAAGGTTGGEGATAAGGTAATTTAAAEGTTGGEGATAAGGTGEFSDDDTGDDEASDEDEDDTGDDDTSVAEFSEGGDDETSDGSTDDDGGGSDGDDSSDEGDGGDGGGDGGDGGGDEG
jgi:hypothetical protein